VAPSSAGLLSYDPVQRSWAVLNSDVAGSRGYEKPLSRLWTKPLDASQRA
jgi:hypothetical protein